MCGIVGYIGRRDAVPVLLEGLRSLEYRGYDSAGLAVIHRNRLQVTKTAGRVQDLRDRVSDRTRATIGIGHTRWATHGEPNEANAHPHTDAEGRIAIVHNGIIENAEQLRDALTGRGVKLVSDTDTEALAHMIAAEATDGTSLEEAVRQALRHVDGTYGLVVLDARYPDDWSWPATAARSCSASATRRCSSPRMWPRWSATPARSCTWTTARWRRCTPPTTSPPRSTSGTGAPDQAQSKVPTTGGRAATTSSARYTHFMRKEIHEQPKALERALRGRLDERFHTAHARRAEHRRRASSGRSGG